MDHMQGLLQAAEATTEELGAQAMMMALTLVPMKIDAYRGVKPTSWSQRRPNVVPWGNRQQILVKPVGCCLAVCCVCQAKGLN